MSMLNPFQIACQKYLPGIWASLGISAGGFQKTYITVTTATNQILVPLNIDFTYMEIWGSKTTVDLFPGAFYTDDSGDVYLQNIQIYPPNSLNNDTDGMVVRKLDTDTYVVSTVRREGENGTYIKQANGTPYIKLSQFNDFPIGLEICVFYQ